MGPACEDPCTNGTQVPMDSGNCVCDPCFTGRGCNVECTGHGICVGNKCQCDELTGWRGSLCEVPGCPGSNGKDCSGNGKCDSANHQCICLPGRQRETCVVLLRKVLFGRVNIYRNDASVSCSHRNSPRGKAVQYLTDSQLSIRFTSATGLAGKFHHLVTTF